MSDEPEPKPKLIIDEDWKSQVQAEKEAAQQLRDDDTPEQQQSDIPTPSFSVLVSSFATQAMIALGQLVERDAEPTVQPELARHCIDMLGVLEEKTKGNLTTEEQGMLDQVLHDLRMLYESVANQPTGNDAE